MCGRERGEHRRCGKPDVPCDQPLGWGFPEVAELLVAYFMTQPAFHKGQTEPARAHVLGSRHDQKVREYVCSILGKISVQGQV